jgi:hypothetical protein
MMMMMLMTKITMMIDDDHDDNDESACSLPFSWVTPIEDSQTTLVAPMNV